MSKKLFEKRRIRIQTSVVRICGSGSVSKCQGSITLLTWKDEPLLWWWDSFLLLYTLFYPLYLRHGEIFFEQENICIPELWTDPKLKKKNTAENFCLTFWLKISIYLSLGLHKGGPGLQEKPSALKRDHPALQKWNLLTFSILVGKFCPPGSGSRLRIRIQGPLWIRIHADPVVNFYIKNLKNTLLYFYTVCHKTYLRSKKSIGQAENKVYMLILVSFLAPESGSGFLIGIWIQRAKSMRIWVHSTGFQHDLPSHRFPLITAKILRDVRIRCTSCPISMTFVYRFTVLSNDYLN